MITNLDFFIEQWIPNNTVTLSSKAIWLLVVNSSSASHLITADQKNLHDTLSLTQGGVTSFFTLKIVCKLECIPLGCIPTVAVAVTRCQYRGRG